MYGIALFNQCPGDIIWRIGLQLTARDFAAVLQVSTILSQLFSHVYERLAREERERVGIQSAVIPLNSWQFAEQWGRLTAEEARALRIDLMMRPSMIYGRIAAPAMVLLRDKFLAVRFDHLALSKLAMGHLNFRQAAILASQISDEKIRATTIHALVERAIDERLPESTILEFISQFLIPPEKTPEDALRGLRADMPLEKIKESLRKVLSAKKRDKILHALALKKGMETDKAVSLARLIHDPLKRDCVLFAIAIQEKIALKDVTSIISFIEDPVVEMLVYKLKKCGYFLNKNGGLIKEI
jgi:hypothetical protein